MSIVFGHTLQSSTTKIIFCNSLMRIVLLRSKWSTSTELTQTHPQNFDFEENKGRTKSGNKQEKEKNEISIPMSTVGRVVSTVCWRHSEQKTHRKNGRESEEKTISCTCVDIQTISIKRNCLYNESILVFLSFDSFLLALFVVAAEIFVRITILQCEMYECIILLSGEMVK